MKAERILMTDFRNNAKKYVDEMYRGKHFCIGKSEKTIGCTDFKSVQKLEVSDNDKQEKFEGLKKGVGIKIEPTEGIGHGIKINDSEFLKLSGEIPLDLNEFINEESGDLDKFKCDFCQTSKTLIKMNPDGNNICLNCSPSIPAFASYKSLVEYAKKPETVILSSAKLHKQATFSNEVTAIPKPVKKKKK